MLFDHRRLVTRYKRGEDAKDDIASKLVPALKEKNATLYGAFASQLGLHGNEIVVITRWPSASAANTAEATISNALQVEHATPRLLTATARPNVDSLTRTTGIFVHRWFTFNERDWPEFLQLSTEAWPDFEATYDAEIQAFLKTPPDADGTSAVLLLTQYKNHGEWERSRTPAGRAQGAWVKFRRRHELTVATIAVSTTLLSHG
ncbi:MAG: hypothetical protein ACREXT_12285 [Gammaproteobacteria bacterium]